MLFDNFFDKHKIFKIKDFKENTIFNIISKYLNNENLESENTIFKDTIKNKTYEVKIIKEDFHSNINVGCEEIFIRLSLFIDYTDYLFYEFKSIEKKKLKESINLMKNLENL